MKKADFKKTFDKANKLEGLFHDSCSDLAILFQPYFNYEISVLFQESDGFVIFYDENNSNALVNESVQEAFKNIQKDKDFYR